MTKQSQSAIPWGWLECFIPILFLLNGLLLFPGTQPLRFAVRAIPYAASLASWIWICSRRRLPLPPGGFLMQLALLLLVLNLFHPETQLKSGISQAVFQAAIIGPAFWAASLIDNERRLARLLWIVFACNLAGALTGILQVYFPDQFLPAEFSASASAEWLRSLTFTSPAGRVLVRPPGLSDLPGGAAAAGSLTAIFGFALSSARGTSIWLRCVCFAAALAGVSVLYLTQVRSLTLMTVLAILLLASFGIREGRIWNRSWMAGTAVILILGSFTWAVSAGGDKVRDRFLNLTDRSVTESFNSSRGWFWRYTFHEALEAYPLGAGPGRWGMMNVYFGDPNAPGSPTLWAEIQPTGWLYDGGVPMWLLYGSGLFASMLFLYRIARSRRYGSIVPFAATVIFCVNCNIIGASFFGPAFNTTLGMEYWLLVAIVFGAARRSWRGPSLQQIRDGFVYSRAASLA